MLKKLFVHEWKETWRLVTIMNLIVVGLTLIGAFFLNNETWNSMDKNEFIAVTVVVYMMFFIASIAALSMVVTFYFFIRFYKNLYTDQGYLMHTLPVTSAQLIWSKTFVAVIWMLISVLVMIGAIFSLVMAAVPGAEFAEIWKELRDAFAMMDFDGRVVLIVILYIVALLAGQLSSVFMGYASISIGQTFKKQKVLGAIGVYIGIYMLIQTISSYATMFISLAMDPYVIESSMEDMNFIIVFLLILILMSVLLCAGFYFITHHIMKNKLNLE